MGTIHSQRCVTRLERAELWASRIRMVQSQGMAEVAREAVKRWFTNAFQIDHPDTVADWQKRVSNTTLEGYVGIARSIQRMDLRFFFSWIECLICVVSGELDSATRPGADQEIVDLVHGASLRILSGASHLWPLESAQRLNSEMRDWLLGADNPGYRDFNNS